MNSNKQMMKAHPHKGQLQVIYGPMFSGKTTELLRRIRRYKLACYKCLVIKYEKDNRYNKQDVSTHDRQFHQAIACSKLKQVKPMVSQFEVIGIDEGQFYPDIIEFCEEMMQQRKTVIVAALDGDFQKKPFGNILELVPIAESVIKLSAVCMQCYEEAAFTKRIGSDTQLEVIGGADKYMAACRACHEKNENENTHTKRLEDNIQRITIT